MECRKAFRDFNRAVLDLRMMVPGRLTFMPRRTSTTLTESELRLMNVLWQKGSATVHQVLEALAGKPLLAYNTVLTTIRILEKKGYVKHIKDGRAHNYMPLVGQEEATRFEVRNLVSRFFKNSHELLVLNILESKDMDDQELQRVSQLLETSRREQGES
jgi:BlaI family transcriptional regulator, penicillinase repressor